ncbi:hypothetical protein RFN28_16670 [Mesorhizobium sp. VK24D]|uniref:ABC transmembrane type-1 domain-containing protein n=1 Tax=Mesorhizobium album TaxID=3072314 RepID=A0ABU4XZH0_9HYPH|nr:hypothetical protein [Mesorhizobium sp. VK24D]MDX8480101.1 hypothetical protein [Mesorhizobium sp. VK24D]
MRYSPTTALPLGSRKSASVFLKISIPGIVNTFIGLVKDTTLVMFIGLLDPIALAAAIRANTEWQEIYWELFIFIAAQVGEDADLSDPTLPVMRSNSAA